MTKLQIISKLWSSVYDLLLLAKGTPVKTLDEIEKDLDLIEYYCRPYADEDDPEERGGDGYGQSDFPCGARGICTKDGGRA